MSRESGVQSDSTNSSHEGGGSRAAVFLDRDGVLNRDSPDYIRGPEELHVLPGAAESVAKLNRAGYLCVVVTNQSGIARGFFDMAALDALHQKLAAEMEAGGARLDAIYYCPHGPEDGCDCRKPSSGMLRRAASEHNINLRDSWIVGDRPSDIECGHAAGCRTILVQTGAAPSFDSAHLAARPDFVKRNIVEAVDTILSS